MRRYWRGEIMKELEALLEHIEIYRLLQRRKRKTSGKRMNLDTLLKEQNLSV
jgi:hypothetical protein